MKKLLLVVIGVFVLGASFMFSGCAKQSSGPLKRPAKKSTNQHSGSLGYLSYKVHNWNRIKQVNPSMIVKYNKVCWKKVYGHWDYISAHYNRLQFYNISKNCKIVAPPRPAAPKKP